MLFWGVRGYSKTTSGSNKQLEIIQNTTLKSYIWKPIKCIKPIRITEYVFFGHYLATRVPIALHSSSKGPTLWRYIGARPGQQDVPVKTDLHRLGHFSAQDPKTEQAARSRPLTEIVILYASFKGYVRLHRALKRALSGFIGPFQMLDKAE